MLSVLSIFQEFQLGLRAVQPDQATLEATSSRASFEPKQRDDRQRMGKAKGSHLSALLRSSIADL